MKERTLMRWIHLIGSMALGMFVYSPWRNYPLFVLTMQVLIVPVLTFSGLWMWKGHQLKKLFASLQKRLIPSSID